MGSGLKLQTYINVTVLYLNVICQTVKGPGSQIASKKSKDMLTRHAKTNKKKRVSVCCQKKCKHLKLKVT
jgi:hypothetical protein